MPVLRPKRGQSPTMAAFPSLYTVAALAFVTIKPSVFRMVMSESKFIALKGKGGRQKKSYFFPSTSALE